MLAVAVEPNRPTVQREGAQVVVVGSFNPAIFSPAWFEVHEIVGADQVADADVQLIMPNVAVFRVGWLRCQVDNTRLTFDTEDSQEYSDSPRCCDGCAHPPASYSGIGDGSESIFPPFVSGPRGMASSRRHLDTEGDLEGVLTFPGMASVTLQGACGNKYPGSFNVTVQPSNLERPGVFLQTNDHFVLRVDDTQPKSRDDFVDMQIAFAAEPPNEDRIPIALEVLNKEWNASVDRSYEVLQRVLTL